MRKLILIFAVALCFTACNVERIEVNELTEQTLIEAKNDFIEVRTDAGLDYSPTVLEQITVEYLQENMQDEFNGCSGLHDGVRIDVTPSDANWWEVTYRIGEQTATYYISLYTALVECSHTRLRIEEEL